MQSTKVREIVEEFVCDGKEIRANSIPSLYTKYLSMHSGSALHLMEKIELIDAIIVLNKKYQRNVQICIKDGLPTVIVEHLVNEFMVKGASDEKMAMSMTKKSLQLLHGIYRCAITVEQVQALFQIFTEKHRRNTSTSELDDDKVALYLATLELIAKSSFGPISYYDFSSANTGIQIAEWNSFPNHGYTFCMWMRIEESAAIPSVLFSFYGQSSSGLEAVLDKQQIVLQTYDGKKMDTHRIVVNHIIPCGQWQWIAISHTHRQLRGSKVQVFLNGDLVQTSKLHYPSTSLIGKLVHASIGCHSKPTMKPQYLNAQIGPLALFNQAFSPSSIAEIKTLSAFDSRIINATMMDHSGHSSSHGILFSYDARNCSRLGDTCYDCSPNAMHGSAIGEKLVVKRTSTFKECIWQLGGPVVLLPLLLRKLSNPTITIVVQPLPKNYLLYSDLGRKSIVKAVALLGEVMRYSSVNRLSFRRHNGILKLSLLLRMLEPGALTLELFAATEKLAMILSSDAIMHDEVQRCILYNFRIWVNAAYTVQNSIFDRIQDHLQDETFDPVVSVKDMIRTLSLVYYKHDDTSLPLRLPHALSEENLQQMRCKIMSIVKQLLLEGDIQLSKQAIDSFMQYIFDQDLGDGANAVEKFTDLQLYHVTVLLLELMSDPKSMPRVSESLKSRGGYVAILMLLERKDVQVKTVALQVLGAYLKYTSHILTAQDARNVAASLQTIGLWEFNALFYIVLGVNNFGQKFEFLSESTVVKTKIHQPALFNALVSLVFVSSSPPVLFHLLRYTSLLVATIDSSVGKYNRNLLLQEENAAWISHCLYGPNDVLAQLDDKETELLPNVDTAGLQHQTEEALVRIIQQSSSGDELRINAIYALGEKPGEKTALETILVQHMNISIGFTLTVLEQELLNRKMMTLPMEISGALVQCMQRVNLETLRLHFTNAILNILRHAISAGTFSEEVAPWSLFEAHVPQLEHSESLAAASSSEITFQTLLAGSLEDVNRILQSNSSTVQKGSVVYSNIEGLCTVASSVVLGYNLSSQAGVTENFYCNYLRHIPAELHDLEVRLIDDILLTWSKFQCEFDIKEDANLSPTISSRSSDSDSNSRIQIRSNHPGGAMRQCLQLSIRKLGLFVSEDCKLSKESDFIAVLTDLASMVKQFQLGERIESDGFVVEQSNNLFVTSSKLLTANDGHRTTLVLWLVPCLAEMLHHGRQRKWAGGAKLLADIVNYLLATPIQSIDALQATLSSTDFTDVAKEVARRDHFHKEHFDTVQLNTRRKTIKLFRQLSSSLTTDSNSFYDSAWLRSVRSRDEDEMRSFRRYLLRIKNLSGLWCEEIVRDSRDVLSENEQGIWKVDEYTSSTRMRGRIIRNVDHDGYEKAKHRECETKSDIVEPISGVVDKSAFLQSPTVDSPICSSPVITCSPPISLNGSSSREDLPAELALARSRCLSGTTDNHFSTDGSQDANHGSQGKLSFRLKRGMSILKSTVSNRTLGGGNDSFNEPIESNSSSPVQMDIVQNENEGMEDTAKEELTCTVCALNAELITPECVVLGKIRLTNSTMIFQGQELKVPYGRKNTGEDLPLPDVDRYRLMKRRSWGIRVITFIYRRRYLLQNTALEFFFVDGSSCFLNFEDIISVDRIYAFVSNCKPPCLVHNRLYSPAALVRQCSWTEKWKCREISNFEYLMQLNFAAGRSYNDLTQYPIFPWILNDYGSKTIDLKDPKVYRDLSKPIGALGNERFQNLEQKFQEMQNNPENQIPPYHYGSHYSSVEIVLYYLNRMEPFASLALKTHNNYFEIGHKLFSSIEGTFQHCQDFKGDFKELIPEFFYFPNFLGNSNNLPIEAVQLPPWASTPGEFVRINRMALESEQVSAKLHLWIDLIFGHLQRGQAAVEAKNVFYYLSYAELIDLDGIHDAALKKSVESQIANFGQVPAQLFREEHPMRMSCEEALEHRYPNAHNVASMSSQSQIRRKDVDNCHDISISTICFVPDTEIAYSIDAGGKVNTLQYIPDSPDSGAFPFTLEPTSQTLQLPIGSESCTAILYYNQLITCGHWDGSWRISWSNDGSPLQRIPFHKNIIQCMAFNTDISTGDLAIAFGSADGTVSVWAVSKFSATRGRGLFSKHELPVGATPWALLTGHTHAVSCVALCVDLDIVVSGSSHNIVLIHALRGGEQLHALKLPADQNFDSSMTILNLSISTFGNIVVHAKVQDVSELFLYSMNGCFLARYSIKDEVKNASVLLPMVLFSRNGNCIVTASAGRFGGIDIRHTESLTVYRRIESKPSCHLTAIALSQDERCVLAGYQDGSIVAYAMHYGLVIPEKMPTTASNTFSNPAITTSISRRELYISKGGVSIPESILEVLNYLSDELGTVCVAEEETFEHLLAQLWYAVYDNKNLVRSGPAWTDLGFQRPDPTTDFRAGGILSLRCLLYFAKHYPEQMTVMYKSQIPGSKSNTYPLCPAGINITCHLTRLLWDPNGSIKDSPNMWKLIATSDAFYEIFCECFRSFYFFWSEMKAEYTGFSGVLQAMDIEIGTILAENVTSSEEFVRSGEERRIRYMSRANQEYFSFLTFAKRVSSENVVTSTESLDWNPSPPEPSSVQTREPSIEDRFSFLAESDLDATFDDPFASLGAHPQSVNLGLTDSIESKNATKAPEEDPFKGLFD